MRKNRANSFLFLHVVCACLFLFLIWIPLYAQDSSAASAYQAHTQVELIADTDQIQPGIEFQAGVLFRMDPEWHVYWKNPGDSGMTPVFKWDLPEGISAGEVQWPTPKKIDLPPLSSYGYEGEVLLAVPFQVSPDFNPNAPIRLKVKVEWLACKVECIPGQAELEIATPFPVRTDIFEKTKARYPIQDHAFEIHAERFDKNIELTFFPQAGPVLEQAYFFPENAELVAHAETQSFTVLPQGYRLSVPLAVTQPKILKRLRGVLVSGERAWEIDIPFETNAAPIETPLRFQVAVLFAFLGGLILNLMPCVLPVLSLKVLSFVNESRLSRDSALKQGLIFTAGVLISFWVLAGALMLLKSGGQQIGWGFQLQSPWFVAGLAIVFLILAFNLFGFFEIGLSLTGAGQNLSAKKGWAGTFASGILAVVVATPCTAPFMGMALGYALTQPAWVAWAVFTALGLGLASPYVLLCANPAWLRFIPKPGPWMVTLKKLLGVLLLLTALWLGWIFAVQTGLLKFTEQKFAHQLNWEPYSEMRLAQLLADGKPVFVDFTAAWCLTCQVNERLALDRKETAALFKNYKVTALKADWTSRDETITRALAAHGRNSIPFYLFYPGKGEEPIILPEILTPKIIRETLEKASDLQSQTK